MAFNWDNLPTQQANSTSNTPQIDWDNLDKHAAVSKMETTKPTNSPAQIPMNTLSAIGTGAIQGMDQFATTLLKLNSKYGLADKLASLNPVSAVVNAGYNSLPLPKVTPENIQNTYNSNYNQYYKPAQEQHPYASAAGQLLGNTVATAPLMAVPGVQGAGISSLTGLGKLGLSGANMAAQGALLGGLTTDPYQDPNTTINQPKAISGGATGLLLGTTVGPMLSNWADETNKYLTAKANLPGVTQLSSDINKDGFIGAARQWLSNSVLNKLPNIFGTDSIRPQQLQEASQVLGNNIANSVQGNYVNGLIKNYSGKGITALGNLLEKHSQEINQQENTLWNTAKTAMQSTGKTINLQSGQNIKELIDSPGIASSLNKNLQELPSTLSPQQAINLKGDIWKNYSSLAKQFSAGTLDADKTASMNQLRQKYWDIAGDLKNTFQGTTAEAPLNTASTFTAKNKQMFDPATRSQLVDAIHDANDQAGHVTDFYKWLTKGASQGEQQDINKVLGTKGINLIQQKATGDYLANLYNSSMKNIGTQPVLDVDKFLSGIASGDNKVKGYFNTDSVKQLSDLTQILKDYAASQGPKPGSVQDAVSKGLKSYSLNATTVGAAGYGLSHFGPAGIGLGAGILATPAVLSTLIKYSPLKNVAGIAGKALSADTKQFLSNRIGDLVSRAGIFTDLDGANNVILKHTSDMKSELKNKLQLSKPVPTTTITGIAG